MNTSLEPLARRAVLRSAVSGLGAAMITAGISGCGPREQDAPMPLQEPATSPSAQITPGARERRRVLLAYFSRAGENYYYGGRTNLDVGNTEVLASTIGNLIACDVHRIEAADPYPDGYDATVARNVREQDGNARPAMASPLASIEEYDTVLLASGIWNVRAPMIMTTFAESYDFTGKTIHAVTTHAMSGLGTTERDYARSCPGATIGEGLAVRGEDVRDAGPAAEAWLRRTGLLQDRSSPAG
ncbi:flavodoxin [Arthrobacter sp. 131MFCol6.1]|uniref:flavodoxin n=1 Tax=Arthrobacter sp. 131MFCol6.1 TaxID=1157944 RepID=UPI00036AD240|nr:flavodoxin [Arthrobacter sp. 131MFCol6.1]